MNQVRIIRYSQKNSNHEENRYPAFVVPIFFPTDGTEPQFIMVRAAPGSRRVGKLEFPGGTNDGEPDNVTAARECREETCNYLDLQPDELQFCIRKILSKTSIYYVQVPFMSNTKFQENLAQETRKPYLEMDKLVRVPISNFFKNNKPIFPTSDIKIKSVYGTEFTVWKFAAMMIFQLLRRIGTDRDQVSAKQKRSASLSSALDPKKIFK